MNQGPLVSLSGSEFKMLESIWGFLMFLTLVNWFPSCQTSREAAVFWLQTPQLTLDLKMSDVETVWNCAVQDSGRLTSQALRPQLVLRWSKWPAMRSRGFHRSRVFTPVEMDGNGRSHHVSSQTRKGTSKMEFPVYSHENSQNLFSKYWNHIKSHEITKFSKFGSWWSDDLMMRHSVASLQWSGHWGGLRPRGSAEQGSMCCHRRNLAVNPQWQSLKSRKF